VYSSTMRLSTFCGLHRDTEQLGNCIHYSTKVKYSKSLYKLIEYFKNLLWTKPEVGMRNCFLSPQSQFRNLKEAIPQSQFRNFLRNVAPQPQLYNSAIAIFSAVRNFKSSTWELHFRNFQHIFGRVIRSIHEKKSEVKNLMQMSL
jgi:hypothetical protein